MNITLLCQSQPHTNLILTLKKQLFSSKKGAYPCKKSLWLNFRQYTLYVLLFSPALFLLKVVHEVGLCITLFDITDISDSYTLPGDGSAHTPGRCSEPSCLLLLFMGKLNIC